MASGGAACALPPQLLAVCQQEGLAPDELIDWSVGKDRVIVVLQTGQKLVFAHQTAWQKPAAESGKKPTRAGRAAAAGKE